MINQQADVINASIKFGQLQRQHAQAGLMPRPCAVESHAGCYKRIRQKVFGDATASRRGVSRWQL
jgi:hypothetical protein